MNILYSNVDFKPSFLNSPFGSKNFMVTPCFNNIQHFIFQLMYTAHSTHTSQFITCSHNTDNVLYELYVSTLNQVYTRNFS